MASVLDEPSPKGLRRSSGTILKDNKDESEDEAVEVDKETDNEEDEAVQEFDVYRIEYEPEEASDADEPPNKPSGDNSSGESEIDDAVVIATVTQLLQDSDDSEGADASESENDFTKCDLENLDSWTCMECKQPNTPYIRYCSACYKERKGWLPARPKPKKKRNTLAIKNRQLQKVKYERSLSEESTLTKTSIATSTSEENLPESQDSGFSEEVAPSSSTDAKIGNVETEISSDEELLQNRKKALITNGKPIADLCSLCYTRPKNACLIHGRTSHQLCCYPCAKRLYKKKQGCPVCRRKIEKITKNIVA